MLCWSWYLAAAAVESLSPAECGVCPDQGHGAARLRAAAWPQLHCYSYSYSRLLPSTTYAVDSTHYHNYYTPPQLQHTPWLAWADIRNYLVTIPIL